MLDSKSEVKSKGEDSGYVSNLFEGNSKTSGEEDDRLQKEDSTETNAFRRRASWVNSVEQFPVTDSQKQMLLWAFFASYLPDDIDSLQREFVRHAEYTLALTHNQLNPFASFQALAYCFRDRLVERWKDTETFFQQVDTKTVNYLSMEYLLGRSLQNTATNIGIKNRYAKALRILGFNMEEIAEQETDAGLGNGGLGRLAACFMDSLATMDYPAWGYGLRYNYGMFAQSFSSGGDQVETPDYWLNFGTPWEIQRLDIQHHIHFGGTLVSHKNSSGEYVKRWESAYTVVAVAYDMPVPGYKTQNTLNIRLWSSKPSSGFDLESFNKGDYFSALENKQMAENITNVLYPNDSTTMGKELRLKQEYFFVAATIADIMTRFKERGKPISQLADFVSIQLNDTHPALGIVELMRILLDEEHMSWEEAWRLTTKTFSYTNHTVLPEALECWPVEMLQRLLPRHLDLIFEINFLFLKYVDQRWPGDEQRRIALSIINENPKMVRMSHLAIIGSHCVNGVAKIHTNLLKTAVFPEFVEMWPDKFVNITNGVTPRRWVLQANPYLSELITEALGVKHEWAVNTDLLRGLENFVGDSDFLRVWAGCKRLCKERLAEHIQREMGITVNVDALFDVQAKRFHEYKRQLLNCLGIIARWQRLKEMAPEERAHVVPRVFIFGGKAAPGYWMAKQILKLINNVGRVLNEDPDTKDVLTVVVVPNYGVSTAELLTPASDISEHISTAGTEASGTSNMKFAFNGGLIVGTWDGANVEIAEEIGRENIFVFGELAENVPAIREKQKDRPVPLDPRLERALQAVTEGVFGNPEQYMSVVASVTTTDWYLVARDFAGYMDAQARVDAAYAAPSEWVRMSVLSTARMGRFSSDRAIGEYAERVWGIVPCRKSAPVPISVERMGTSATRRE